MAMAPLVQSFLALVHALPLLDVEAEEVFLIPVTAAFLAPSVQVSRRFPKLSL